VVRLKVKHIDSAQKIIWVEQSKGRCEERARGSADSGFNSITLAAASP
jgi:hypothetical protein